MAGFFGMFDTSKPGPGVSKDEPKKKRFFLFWELYFRKFGKMILVNFLYWLVSLPIVTRGLADAGMAFVTRNYAREKHVFLPSDYFDTIKKNWKQALISSIIEWIITALLAFDLYLAGVNLLYAKELSVMALIFFAVSLCVAFFYIFLRYYLYLLMVTFKYTTKQLWKNSFYFTILGLKENLIISAVLLFIFAVTGVLIVYLQWLVVGPLLLLYILFYPSFRSFLINFTVFPLIQRVLIDPYYEQHPDEDVDKRQDLNLEVKAPVATTTADGDDGAAPATETAEDAEVIFKDMGRDERPVTNIPKQYSRDEMLKGGRRLQRDSVVDSDEDGTI